MGWSMGNWGVKGSRQGCFVRMTDARATNFNAVKGKARCSSKPTPLLQKSITNFSFFCLFTQLAGEEHAAQPYSARLQFNRLRRGSD